MSKPINAYKNKRGSELKLFLAGALRNLGFEVEVEARVYYTANGTQKYIHHDITITNTFPKIVLEIKVYMDTNMAWKFIGPQPLLNKLYPGQYKYAAIIGQDASGADICIEHDNPVLVLDKNSRKTDDPLEVIQLDMTSLREFIDAI